MPRHHFDVEGVVASVDVVLDAHVGKLHVALVVARQVVFPRPVLNLQRTPVRPAIAVVAIAIALLQELLVLGFQLVLEDDAVDVGAHLVQAFSLFEVGAVDFGVVLQFAGSLDAFVERLALSGVVLLAASVEQVVPFLRQRHDGPVSVEPDRVNESRLPQMPQLATTRVERLVEGIAQVVGRNDPEGAYRGQGAALGAPEGVVVVPEPHVLSFEPTRQVDVPHEHVARLGTFPFTRVRWL